MSDKKQALGSLPLSHQTACTLESQENYSPNQQKQDGSISLPQTSISSNKLHQNHLNGFKEEHAHTILQQTFGDQREQPRRKGSMPECEDEMNCEEVKNQEEQDVRS